MAGRALVGEVPRATLGLGRREQAIEPRQVLGDREAAGEDDGGETSDNAKQRKPLPTPVFLLGRS